MDNFFQQAGNTVNRLINPVPQQSSPDFQYGSNRVTAPARNPLIDALSQAKTNITNFVNNPSPYVAGLQYKAMQTLLPHIPSFSPQQDQQRFDKWYQSSLIDRSFTPNGNEFTSLENPPLLGQAGQSGVLKPFFEPPSSDPRLNALKQATLQFFSPAYQSYLTDIPIVNQPVPDNIAGQSRGEYVTPYNTNAVRPPTGPEGAPRYINIAYIPTSQDAQDPGRSNSDIGTLIHEYLHQAPRNFLSQNGFLNHIYGILQKYPELYQIAKDYTANPQNPNGIGLPNGEEIFARLGDRLGPGIMNYPELAPYYKNIFVQKPVNKGVKK